MAVTPVLRDIAAVMQRLQPGLRVEYGPAATAKQGAPALIWEYLGGPITVGGYRADESTAKTIAVRRCTVVAELRAKDSTQGTGDKDYAAAEELLRLLFVALDEVAPADYRAREDWGANTHAGVAGAAVVACRVAIEFDVPLRDQPERYTTVETLDVVERVNGNAAG